MSPIVLAQLPDPDVARRTTQDVLSQPEYVPVTDGPSVLDRLLWAIAEQLGRLLLRIDGDGGTGSVLAALALVAIILALVLALVVFLRRFRRGAVTPSPLEGPVGRPAADWGAEADGHERAGRWREAMRCRYREAIGALAAAGLVDEIPGRTTGEYRRAVHYALPTAAEPFGDMTDRFDRAWYGGDAVDADELAAFTASHRRVQQAIPRSRRTAELVGP